MTRPLKVGAVMYDPKVSVIWEIIRDFFDAQGVNGKAIDLPLEWLGVNHVDEVIQQTPTGKVLVADPDVAWALHTTFAVTDPLTALAEGYGIHFEALAGHYDAAHQHLRMLLTLHADSPAELARARRRIGSLYENQGQLDAALLLAVHLGFFAPDDPRASRHVDAIRSSLSVDGGLLRRRAWRE